MNTEELNRLRALLAAQAVADASSRRSLAARARRGLEGALQRLRTLARRRGTSRHIPPPLQISSAAGREAPSPPSAVEAVAPTGAQARDVFFEPYLISGFAPRRATFGVGGERRPAVDDLAPAPFPNLDVNGPVHTSEPWAPLSGGFTPHEAETPFFPEDLDDGHDEDPPIRVFSQRARLALTPSEHDLDQAFASHAVPAALAQDYLLADLAARLAGEQYRLDSQLRIVTENDSLPDADAKSKREAAEAA